MSIIKDKTKSIDVMIDRIRLHTVWALTYWEYNSSLIDFVRMFGEERGNVIYNEFKKPNKSILDLWSDTLDRHEREKILEDSVKRFWNETKNYR